MTDRLEDLLAAGPPGDAEPSGLAAGARTRLRTRRRATVAVAASAVVVAAIPVALTLGGEDPRAVDPLPPATTTATPAPDDPATRTETWHRISLQVPADWGYGGGRGWCAVDGSGGRPEVDRPGGSEGRDILCSSQSGYGLTFGDGSAVNWVYDSGHVWQYRWESDDQVNVYPQDSWLGFVQDGDDYALVVTDSQALTRRIVDSAEIVEDVDANGCSVRDGDDAAQGDGDRWSVCRYDAGGRLEESELLSLDETTALQQAIADAPAEPCLPRARPELIVAGAGSDLGSARIELVGDCGGVYLSGVARRVTPEILELLR